MASRFVFTPFGAEFPATSFPQLQLINRRPVLTFDGDANEACQWTVRLPVGWTGTITATIAYIMATDTTGDVDVDVDVEAISDGDSIDLDAADSFDTVNSTDNTTVPGTAGFIDMISVTLTNNDSSAAGDYARFRLTRDAVSDAANGEMHMLWMEIQDGA